MKRLFLVPVFCTLLCAGSVFASEGEKKEGAPETGASEPFVKLPSFALPIIQKDKIVEMVSVQVVLETTDKKAAEAADKVKPRLIDAFLAELYGKFSRYGLLLNNGAVDVEGLKAQLKTESEKVLGEGQVKGVLVQLVSQRAV